MQKQSKKVLSRKSLNKRIAIMNMCLIGAFLFLGFQVAKIKLVKGEEYTKGVFANMAGSERMIKAQRGAIVDRNQKTLATSVLAYDILLSPYDILGIAKEEEREKIYATLATQVNQSKDEIRQIVESRPDSRYYLLAKKMPTEKAEKLKGLGGVALEKAYIRKYPNGVLAAQVIGFFNKNEEGQYGVEQQYEQYLIGKPGREFSQYQASHIVTRELQEAQTGATITLTIDEVIQQYVESTMKKYINEWNPLNASAIIMNPNTGEIYSMFSYPSFNPNQYNNLTEQLGESQWKAMEEQDQSTALLTAWQNHAIQYMYEPGSTFKPLIVAMALEEGAITETETYNCPGHKIVADRKIDCWKKAGHGVQTLDEALANSCNVAMMEIASKLDNDLFLKYVHRYGFGEVTGIELTGEATGLLHNKLGPVEKATYSMGQTLTVTPIQLISAFSSVINGGYLLKPYVVSEIISQQGEVLFEQSRVVRRQVIPTDIAKMVTSYLKKVVDEGGTGHAAAISGYDIGGKTGTGEKFIEVNGNRERAKDEYVVSFMGFAPVNNPQIIGLVVFDGLPEGTGAPAMAFKEMMENILPYLDIELKVTAENEDSNLCKVPDVSNKTIYEAIHLLEQNHFEYVLSGVGSKVTSQYPSSETPWSKGDKVVLYVSTDAMDKIQVVPDLTGVTIQDAQSIVNGLFTIEGSGSGLITSQIPKAGSKIEENNKIIVKTSE